MSTTLLHYQLRDLWRSPRGTVLRIEALALVAIILSFFLAAFGSCRRWSNNWIVQKGFLAAQAISLSLGTYSIGLMQSSSVKSEMYPIWAVSLFSLFGCVDPSTTYMGLDCIGPLSKMIFQLCLYCGYILVMSALTISGVVGNSAIGMLTAITFIKGIHRSLALVLPSRTRNHIKELVSIEPRALAGDGKGLEVHLPYHYAERTSLWNIRTSMADIHSSCNEMMLVGEMRLEIHANGLTIEDVCLGYSLSHLLQRRFLGFTTSMEMDRKREEFQRLLQERNGRQIIDYKRSLKAIEVELAFLYEVYFTGNEFFHYYEAKSSSFWAFASFIGICSVGVSTAIPGALTSHYRIRSTGPGPGPGAGSIVVDTTTCDLVITLVILVSLALLQLVQLIRCWTSNWAKVAFACEYTTKQRIRILRALDPGTREISRRWWVRLKLFVVTRMNWFDKYLWQNKVGQYSVIDAASSRRETSLINILVCVCCIPCVAAMKGGLCCLCIDRICVCLSRMFGLQYIGQVLKELLVSRDNTGCAIRLDDHVKESISDFLCQIKGRRIGVEWSSLFVKNGLADLLEHLPYSTTPLTLHLKGGWTAKASDAAYAFMHRVMIWHIATCYCEDVSRKRKGVGGRGLVEPISREMEMDRSVAIALSKYIAYLVVSAPELLPGPAAETKRAFDEAEKRTSRGTQHI